MGSRVRVRRLVHSSEYNGRIGTVKKVLGGGRVCVELDRLDWSRASGAAAREAGGAVRGRQLSIRAEHVELVGEGEGSVRMRDRVPRSDVKLYKQWLSSTPEAGSLADMFAHKTIPRRFASEVLTCLHTLHTLSHPLPPAPQMPTPSPLCP